MRRSLLILIGIVFLLSGCSPGEDDSSSAIPPPEKSVSSDSGREEGQDWIAYQADSQTFYQTYGWLSNHDILFAELQNGTYIVNSYNFQTGEKKEIYREKLMLIDVKIHPSKKYIALHVSDSSASARIIIITTDGKIVGETEIESSEVYISWNDENPFLLLITAFYEDWSYAQFVFNATNEELKEVEAPDPFLKWFDSDTLLSMQWDEHVLNGAAITKIDWKSGESTLTEFEHVVFLDAHNGKILTVEPREHENEMEYKIRTADGETVAYWTAPALSNYSQWFIPDVQWLADGTLITLVPEKAGLIDEESPEFQFLQVKNGEVQWFDEKVEEAAFNCSPDGTRCLSGYESEKVIQFNPRKVWDWLET